MEWYISIYKFSPVWRVVCFLTSTEVMPRRGRFLPTQSTASCWRSVDDKVMQGRDVVETPEERDLPPEVPSYPIHPWSWGESFLRLEEEVSERRRKEEGADVWQRHRSRKRDRHWFRLVFHSPQRLFKHIDSDSQLRDVCAVPHHVNNQKINNPAHEIMTIFTLKNNKITKLSYICCSSLCVILLLNSPPCFSVIFFCLLSHHEHSRGQTRTD